MKATWVSRVDEAFTIIVKGKHLMRYLGGDLADGSLQIDLIVSRTSTNQINLDNQSYTLETTPKPRTLES